MCSVLIQEPLSSSLKFCILSVRIKQVGDMWRLKLTQHKPRGLTSPSVKVREDSVTEAALLLPQYVHYNSSCAVSVVSLYTQEKDIV